MISQSSIKFVQQLNFSIPKKELDKALRNVKEDGSVKISFGISDEQKIYVSVSPDVIGEEATEESKDTMQQANLAFMRSSAQDPEEAFGCPNPPGCKPPIIY
jgi:hypothetical protein